MTGKLSSSDWAADRGEKWRAHAAGMEAMLAPVDEPLIRALDLRRACRVADVGCGGGGTTLEIRRRAPAGCAVHGFDISEAMIESARDRLGEASDVTFTVADVAAAPAPDEPYDRLTSRFGVMFYDDPPAAFARLARWLTPGGRLAFAVWGPQAENLWASSVREVVAELIEVPRPDPAAPGPFRYADADPLLSLLEEAGFSGLALASWRGELPVGGGLPAAEAARFVIASSSMAEVLGEGDDELLGAARRSLASRYSPHQRDGAVWMGASVHVVTGTRV